MSKQLHEKPSRQRGTRRIEAWIYSVINPLIEGLHIEQSFLRRGNWTWDPYSKDLVSIRPLEGYIESAASPIFEGFFAAHPQMERKRKKHDELRAALREQCQVSFDLLIASNTFRMAVESALSRYTQQHPSSEYPGGAVPRVDFHKLIAQYVLNQVEVLADHHTTSTFWRELRDKFQGFGEEETLVKLRDQGKCLEDECSRLLTALQNLRSKLCKEHDIPEAPVSYLSYPGEYTTRSG